MADVFLMKGNEALAEAAIRLGTDAYFGYPITPQSEILEYLMLQKPEERTGMIVLQAESELAAINMVYGAAATGKKAMTSSSSPGISLKQEGLSYIACAELPCLVVNVARGGPGLGTIQPGQADYFQAVKGGGHGDYHLVVLAPNSVQEMADFVQLGFEIAFRYRIPVMILTDGMIGQMMEKVVFEDPVPRDTTLNYDWNITGKPDNRENRFVTSLVLDPLEMEKINQGLQKKYRKINQEEVRFEEYKTSDAEYVLVAYGSSARICRKTVDIAREKGIKAGLLRPITLYPFPYKRIGELAEKVKGFLSVELSAGQMVEDVKLAVNGKSRVEHFGRYGGAVYSPVEVMQAIENEMVEK